MVLDFIKKKRNGEYVCLPKDKKWIFCFKRKGIIEHKDCDYYEHNLKCKKNGDYWNMTHTDSSICSWYYPTTDCGDGILNECKHCLKEVRTFKRYRLSDEAMKVINDDRY